jgi:AbrB family looped-hinge helix DNA binding protein
VDVKTWEKEFYEIPDSLSFTAFLDERGRITIPASVRRKLKFKSYSAVSVIVKALKIKIKK